MVSWPTPPTALEARVGLLVLAPRLVVLLDGGLLVLHQGRADGLEPMLHLTQLSN